jgi:acyl-CoA reductase-like NAD-dependent aldehyde dehydrogenase
MAEPFIDDVTVLFSGHDRLEILNPAGASVIDSVPEGGQAAVDAAISALKAFPAWRDTPAAERGEILAATAHHLRQHIDELVRSLTSEQGKPLREARQEITRFILTIEHYTGLAKNIRGDYVPDLDKGAYG